MSKPFKEEIISEINIIPFVDIILVILIIFMVTAPQLIKEGFSVNLPKTSSNKKIVPNKFHITVTNTGDIMIKGKLLSIQNLSSYASTVSENNASTKVVISADESVSHGRVMEIINTLKIAGIESFIFSAR